MRYLKTFKEAVIAPYDFDEALSKLKEKETLSIEDMQSELGHMGVEFVDVDEFVRNLETEKEKELVPIDMPPLMGGIRWGAHNVYNNKMYICVKPNEFNAALNNMRPQLFAFLREVLRHESIHRQQAERRPGVTIRNLERSPVDPKKYFGSTDEIMAYADSFIVQCRNRGMSDDQILDAISKGSKVSWIQNVYANVAPESRSRFNKYVYQYLKGEPVKESSKVDELIQKKLSGKKLTIDEFTAVHKWMMDNDEDYRKKVDAELNKDIKKHIPKKKGNK